MKKLMLIFSLGWMVGMSNIRSAEAQVHVSINIDIQPAWGPSGYNYAEFYYIPELNIYYDVINQLFYYYDRGRWSYSPYLPMMYGVYDFYSLYKVVLNHIRNPWTYNYRHRRLYAKYRRNYVQVPIFYMNERRYHRARDNFYGWVEPRHMPGNNGRPHSRDFSKNTRNGRIDNDNKRRTPATGSRSSNNSSRSSTATRNDHTAVRDRTDNSRSVSRDAENRNQTRIAADHKAPANPNTRKEAPAVNNRSANGQSSRTSSDRNK